MPCRRMPLALLAAALFCACIVVAAAAATDISSELHGSSPLSSSSLRGLRLIVSEAKLTTENKLGGWTASSTSKFIHIKEAAKPDTTKDKTEEKKDEKKKEEEKEGGDDKAAGLVVSVTAKHDHDWPKIQPIKSNVVLIEKPSVQATITVDHKGSAPEGATYEVVKSSNGSGN